MDAVQQSEQEQVGQQTQQSVVDQQEKQNDISPTQEIALWYAGIKDTDTMTWIKDRGFHDIDSLAKSAYNLSKLLGHDKAGRTLVLPTETSTQEEITAFRKKLGVPDTPDHYDFGIPDDAQEIDKNFSNKMKQTFLSEGVPKKAAESIARAYNEHIQYVTEQNEEARLQERHNIVMRWKKDQGIDSQLSERALAYGARELMPGKTGTERDIIIDNMIDMFGYTALNILKKVGSLSEDNNVVVNNGVVSSVNALENERKSLLDPKRGTELFSVDTINKLMEIAKKKRGS
jgi:hypothetical protein